MKTLFFISLILVGCNNSNAPSSDQLITCTDYLNMEKVSLSECNTNEKREIDRTGFRSFGTISSIYNLKIIVSKNINYYACNLPDSVKLETIIYFESNTIKVDSTDLRIANPIILTKLWVIH